MKPFDETKASVMIPEVSHDDDGNKRLQKVYRAIGIEQIGKKRTDEVEVRKYGVDTRKYVEKMLFEKGVHRLDRQSGDGLPLRRQHKAGHGGKYTWNGPFDLEKEMDLEFSLLDLDENDPNFDDEAVAYAA